MTSFKRWALALLGAVLVAGCGQEPSRNLQEESAMTTAPYGTWESPISAALTAGSTNGVLALQVDGEDLYWLESRPLEGGRYVLMKHNPSSEPQEITPQAFNVRTRVHEYGGRSFQVVAGTTYFSNFADQALYAQLPGNAPEQLSVSENLRYADCAHDPVHNRLLCVREDHRAEGEAINALVAIDLSGQPADGTILWQQSDFVGYPRVSPDGSQLTWISWDHPNMPWDNVALWLAPINADGSLGDPVRLNEGVDESVLQPTWAADGTLYFLTDRSGWWNLHRFESERISAVHQLEAELGGPLWALGTKFFELLNDQQALVEYSSAEGIKLGVLDLQSGTLEPYDLPYVAYASIVARDGVAYFVAGLRDAPSQIVALDLASGQTSVIRETGERVVAAEYLSEPEAITFPTAGGGEAYGYYYPPANVDFTAPADELPPLMVLMHGGPTAATSAVFSAAKQFWTSRGFAVVDVNYRGSTGYGRAFRQALNGKWGIVDLEDAVAATEYLVAQKKADPNRLLIRGGSAGGYTTLSALAFTDVFAAGANYFGVSDLQALAEHTHKFESRYLDSMVGPYPEAKATYEARSPINALDGFTSPLITFQGLEDRVVPPEQSEMIYQAVKAKGTPTAYIAFEGEQHGFRSAENNITALQSELYFYGKVLGFAPAGDLPAVDIDNLVE